VFSGGDCDAEMADRGCVVPQPPLAVAAYRGEQVDREAFEAAR
jgi:hypothetical protein